MARQDVIRRIVAREMQRLGLSEAAVLQDAPDLHQAACEGFGTWETALQYAGVRRRRLRACREYTPEIVILKIRRHCQKGLSLIGTRVIRQDCRLYHAARAQFGTWRRALRAAGVDLRRARLRATRPRPYNKPQLLEAVRQWGESGHSLQWSDICLENHALAIAAKNVFQGWRRALVAAGIVVDVRHRISRTKWDRARVFTAMQSRWQEGKPMHYTAVCAEASGLLYAARAHFGNWSNALAALGIPPQRCPRKPRLQPSR